MPTDGLSVALATVGGLLVGSGLWGMIRFRLHVRTGRGRSLTMSMELAAARSRQPAEESDDDAGR